MKTCHYANHHLHIVIYTFLMLYIIFRIILTLLFPNRLFAFHVIQITSYFCVSLTGALSSHLILIYNRQTNDDLYHHHRHHGLEIITLTITNTKITNISIIFKIYHHSSIFRRLITLLSVVADPLSFTLQIKNECAVSLF